MEKVFAYAAAAIAVGWGVAHLVPTRKVVAGFGEISRDNRLIITMEWAAEGMALIFVGLLSALVTLVGGTSDQVTRAVYGLAAAMLVAMAVLTATTGARGSVLFFKACPIVKTLAATLLLIGIFV